MSFEITDRLSPVSLVRLIGGLYLSFLVASVLANALGHIGMGDAEQMITVPGTFVSLLAEVGLTLWLLVRGVKVANPPDGLPLATAG